MTTLQRQLINLEILSADLSQMHGDLFGSEKHRKLLVDFQGVINKLAQEASEVTLASYQTQVANVSVDKVFENKQVLAIYERLIGYVLDYWDAHTKAEKIIYDQFDNNADKRLELLQVKAIRAKKQFHTVIDVLGNNDINTALTAVIDGMEKP
jgi:exo-beta-1,3-glucanase (GH17 family)